MPNWHKVTTTRAAAAAKALELLVNTADPKRGYDVDQAQALAMLDALEEKLDAVRRAYRDKAGIAIDPDRTRIEAAAPITLARPSSTPSALEEPRAVPAFVQAIAAADLPTWILHLTNRLIDLAEELRP